MPGRRPAFLQHPVRATSRAERGPVPSEIHPMTHPVRFPLVATPLRLAALAAGLVLSAHVQAQAFIYQPVNPAFGGSPLNGGFLLNRAQLQDNHKERTPDVSAAAGSGTASAAQTAAQTQLAQFNDTLQRVILSRISSAVSSQVVGNDGRLVPGTVQTTDFVINIADLGAGRLRVTTTDKVSGQSTTFDIGQ